MKVLLGASVVCVLSLCIECIEFQNLFSIQNQWTSLIFTRPRVAKYTYLSLVFSCLLLHWTFVFILNHEHGK